MHRKAVRSRTRLRGVVQVEYLMVLLLVVVPAAACLTVLGPQVVSWFGFTSAWLALPVP